MHIKKIGNRRKRKEKTMGKKEGDDKEEESKKGKEERVFKLLQTFKHESSLLHPHPYLLRLLFNNHLLPTSSFPIITKTTIRR